MKRAIQGSVLLVVLAAVGGATSFAAPLSGLLPDSDTSTISESTADAGYGKPNQSRIWFNSRQGRWDALVPRSVGGPSASDHFILSDVNGSATFSQTKSEDRNSGRPDVFWDDAGGRLFVLGSHPSKSRIWRYEYRSDTDTYVLDPAVSAVTVPGIGHFSENFPATLYVTPNGRLWVAVMKNDALEVQVSDDEGASWRAQAILLDPAASTGVTSWTHFTYQGTTYAGLFDGENGETGTGTRFHYRFIDQNADPAVPTNWIDDSSNIPTPFGAEQADDHVHATRDGAENQYFAVKTEGGNPTDPRIKLYRRSASGSWSQFTVEEVQEELEQTRPATVIDEQNRRIYIYTSRTGGGDARRVMAPLDELELLATAPYMSLFDNPDKAFDDVIVPRHAVDATSGVAVLAHNETDNTVWFSFEGVASEGCVTASGGIPGVLDLKIPQTGATGMIDAMIFWPDSGLQVAPCPLISAIPRPGTRVDDMAWAAERLAREGYVVIVTDPQFDTISAYDLAARSGITFMSSSANPIAELTDKEHVGLLGAPRASSALTLTQAIDPRVGALVSWDNLARHERGDRGSPMCFLPFFFSRGTPRPPKVPAMGQASDGCFFRGPESKKTALTWWRANRKESMQVVFEGSNSFWWSASGTPRQHDLIHHYTLAWFDRWLKDDADATDRLVSREVNGEDVESFLDSRFLSAVFLEGYDCPDFEQACNRVESEKARAGGSGALPAESGRSATANRRSELAD